MYTFTSSHPRVSVEPKPKREFQRFISSVCKSGCKAKNNSLQPRQIARFHYRCSHFDIDTCEAPGEIVFNPTYQGQP